MGALEVDLDSIATANLYQAPVSDMETGSPTVATTSLGRNLAEGSAKGGACGLGNTERTVGYIDAIDCDEQMVRAQTSLGASRNLKL